MRILGRFLLIFVGLVRWPLRMWIRVRITPTDSGELHLEPSKPVCYVLPVGGLADWLALEAACKAHGLPRPHLAQNRLPSSKRAVVVSLPRGHRRTRSELFRIVARGIQDRSFDVQMLPVSIFWGRDPSKETSIFRILFADTERPGRLRKLLIILANGRNTLIHFGQPLDYRGFVADEVAPGPTVRKLVRVLRVHFRRQRAITLGPPMSHRSQVINALLGKPEVRAAIRHTARAEGISEESARARARKLADEIAADYSNIAINFMLRLLSWLWNRIYDGVEVRHLQRLRATAHESAVIYLPSHRSHMDYLLISYILYTEGFAPPQIAAGVNLNFWPVGGLLRRCGAFYLRRSFKGDRLYTAVFRAYVEALIHRGQPMKFYPEGGRSRTGRLLPPRTGMLAMTTESFLQHADRPVSVVPVYIGYDRVMEVNSYFDELRGTAGKKKNEGVGDLVRGGRKVLKRKYGRVYVSFGEPIPMREYLDARNPGWRDWQPDPAGQERPEWLPRAVNALAGDVMIRINSAAQLNAAGLVALILLGSPQKAVAEDEMIHSLTLLTELAHEAPYSPDVTIPEPDGHALLTEAEPITRLMRVPHAWGDVLTLESRQAVLLTYTRNNVMHLFALPSLIANFFTHAEQRRESVVLADSVDLYPLLASELFLRWEDDECQRPLRDNLEAMLDRGLLVRGPDGVISRPAAGTQAFAALMSLARIMRESLERYCMTMVLLANNLETGSVDRAKFQRQCQLMAERMAILTGRNSPEFFDLGLFRNHLQTLKRVGLLTAHGDELGIDPRLRERAEHALRLLGPDIRQTIMHLAGRQPTGTEADDEDGEDDRKTATG